MPTENPYDPPKVETKPERSGRVPSVWAWFAVIVGSLVSGGFMFFITCFGVLMLFGVGSNSPMGGRQAGAINFFVLLAIPFLAFVTTLFLFIRGGRKMISYYRVSDRPKNDD